MMVATRSIEAESQAVTGIDEGTVASTADGATFAWGEGGHGCLGHGEDESNQLLPKKVEVWAQE